MRTIQAIEGHFAAPQWLIDSAILEDLPAITDFEPQPA
jgi:hypothetical protein